MTIFRNIIFISQYLFNKFMSKFIGIVWIIFWIKEKVSGEGHFKVLVERGEYKKGAFTQFV